MTQHQDLGVKLIQAEALVKRIEAVIDPRLNALALKYSDDQPRDDQGRWTDTGGGGSSDSSMTSYEDQISGNDFESAGVYKQDGTLIFQQRGGYDVPFTKDQVESMNDAVVTHNHPANYPLELAPDDISMAVYANIKEIRSVQGNKVSSFTRPDDGWGWIKASDVKTFFYREYENWNSTKNPKDKSGMLRYIWGKYAKSIGATFKIEER